jgi:hypothetical protein
MTDADTPVPSDQTGPLKSDFDQAPADEFPICGICGTDRIVRDAWASWDAETKDWEITAVFDYTFCLSCEEEAGLEWQSKPLTKTERIRLLNDALRTGKRKDGTIVITAGIQALDPDLVAEARKVVATFTDFNADNDPHGEHDFGAVIVSGEKLFFKIDYYDLSMSAHSPNAADPTVTKRVLTIMLASEY